MTGGASNTSSSVCVILNLYCSQPHQIRTSSSPQSIQTTMNSSPKAAVFDFDPKLVTSADENQLGDTP